MLAITVYVPSESNGRPIDAKTRQRCLEATLSSLSHFFGGATAIEGQGAWVNSDGALVRERVTLCQSFTDDETANKYWAGVLAIAHGLKKDLSQESVLVTRQNSAEVSFV